MPQVQHESTARLDMHRSLEDWDRILKRLQEIMTIEQVTKSEACKMLGVSCTQVNIHLRRQRCTSRTSSTSSSN